ncbi:MAG: aminoglycoside phosphotransferase family protein [Desulfomonilaceae bacterium]
MNESICPSDLLRASLPAGCEIIRIEKIAGDASTRKYYRLFLNNRDPLVLMAMADPSTDEARRFLAVQQFLRDLGLPVPAVHWRDVSAGVIVLQDLGTCCLEDVIKNSHIGAIRPLYEAAVEILIRLQRNAKPHHHLCENFNPRFTPAKFMEEFAFFITHYVRNVAEDQPSPKALKTLTELLQEICGQIDFDHPVFCHRDYHARNIMLHEGNLAVIDFQDARLGPAQYDLASLLRDSYVSLPEELVDELITRFYENAYKELAGSFDHFRYLFDVVSLQRNIKALGTFGYQTYVRASTRYLSAIPRTCEYIQSNIRKYPRFSRFTSIVDDLIYGPGLSIFRERGGSAAEP